MSSVLELEARIKDIVEKDPKNPDLYLAIRDLAEKLLVVKRFVDTRDEIDMISHDFAADFYMELMNGKQVVCWTKYIWLRLFKYRERFLDNRRKESYNTSDPVTIKEFKEIHQGSKRIFERVKEMELEDLIASIPVKSYEIFDEYCRYPKGSVKYNRVLLSVLLTINKNRYVCFHLPDSFENYIRFMSRLLFKELYNYMAMNLDRDLRAITDSTSYFEVMNFD